MLENFPFLSSAKCVVMSSRHWVSGEFSAFHTQPISFAVAEVLICFPSRSLVINCCLKNLMEVTNSKLRSPRSRGRALTEVSPCRTCTEPKPPWKQPASLPYARSPQAVFGPLLWSVNQAYAAARLRKGMHNCIQREKLKPPKKGNGQRSVHHVGQPLQGSHEYVLICRPPGCMARFSPMLNTDS